MHVLRPLLRLTPRSLLFKPTQLLSRIPTFNTTTTTCTTPLTTIHVLDSSESHLLPSHKTKQFTSSFQTKSVSLSGSGSSLTQTTTSYYSQTSWTKIPDISASTSVIFSQAIQKHPNFLGIASEVLMKGYKYSRKQKDEKKIQISIEEGLKEREYVIALVKSKMQAAEWANSRADEATTGYMLDQALQVAKETSGIKVTVIKGKELLTEGFRLMHAVGRASEHEPAMVSLEYKGDPTNNTFIALVGKGVCFDSGGLNLKPTASIGGMHNDKHGACSVLSTIKTIAKLNLKINIVATLGLVQNSISSNAYHPLDIITSRKGLTVEIGNTDAQGRLVLADCMHWVQEKYQVKTMLDMATLTGAVIIALGKNRAGLFSNSDDLVKELLGVGEEIQEKTWQLPLEEYHDELIKSKQADITNASRQPEASSCQAAAFLKRFVEPGVEWAHLDIAGTADSKTYSTGYGAKLLLHFLKKRAAA